MRSFVVAENAVHVKLRQAFFAGSWFELLGAVGKPTSKIVEETTNQCAFLVKNLEMNVSF